MVPESAPARGAAGRRFPWAVAALSLLLNAVLLAAVLEPERGAAWFGLKPRAQSTSGTARSATARAAAERPAGQPPARPAPGTLGVDSGALADPREIAAFMQSAGIHRDVIWFAVRHALRMRDAAEHRRIVDADNWDRRHQLSGKSLPPEAQKAMRELDRRQEQELNAIMGPDNDLAQVNAEIRRVRFGSLSNDKVNAVLRLEREMQGDLQKAAEPRPDGSRLLTATAREAVEREFVTDLASVLTPAEVQDYLRYNSVAAQRLQTQLMAVSVDEATYAQMADRALAFEQARQATQEDNAKLIALRSGLNADYRRLLGDERFLAFDPQLDTSTASLDPLLASAGRTARERADFFLEFNRRMNELRFLPPAQQAAPAATLLRELLAHPALAGANRAKLDETIIVRNLRNLTPPRG